MRVFSLNFVLIIIGQQSNIGVSGQANILEHIQGKHTDTTKGPTTSKGAQFWLASTKNANNEPVDTGKKSNLLTATEFDFAVLNDFVTYYESSDEKVYFSTAALLVFLV